MPVRSQGQLLAAAAALVGLCVAGAGCQRHSLCQPCCSPCTECAASGQPTSGKTVAWRARICQPVSRPLAVLASTREPELAPACDRCGTPVATMLRPVPVGAPLSPPGAADSGGWSPVQRVSASGAAAEGGISQAVTMERPQPVAFVPATTPAGEESLRPVPVLLEAVTQDAKPDEGKARPKDDEGNGKSRLPMPNEKDDKRSPYPTVSKPLMTHPPTAPREFTKRALSTYIIEPPDVLAIEGSRDIVDPSQPITGPHLVRPDGTIGLGSYGAIFVAGCTLDQAKAKIIERLMERQPNAKIRDLWEGLKVDVAAFNSKFYYVIADGGGYGETVIRIPITGNETVLDAISQIQGLPVVACKKLIWVARATPDDHTQPMILPVDWLGITQRGSAATNYQIFPGDRVFVHSDPRIRLDTHLAKIISPIERLFGITLLGATTVNAIKGNQGGGGNNR